LGAPVAFAAVPHRAKVFEYAAEVDRAGRMTIPGGAQIESPEGWSADHLLLAALIRCSIDSLIYHAHRGGHEVAAQGQAQGTITKANPEAAYKFVSINVRIEAQLTPRTNEVDDLAAKAERDCFVGASLNVKPTYDWQLS
jgi:organic hydroperoxide reductase OsmC/OhrA